MTANNNIKKAIKGAADYAKQMKNDGKLKFPLNDLTVKETLKNPTSYQSVISNSKGCKIDITAVPTNKHLSGYIKTYYDNNQKIYKIRYSNGVNVSTCMTRFIICKELAHIFLQTSNNMTCSYQDVEDLLASLISNSPYTHLSPALDVERVAFLATTEMLIPSSEMDDYVKGIKYLRKKGYDNDGALLALARRLRVPENVVQLRFSSVLKGLFV